MIHYLDRRKQKGDEKMKISKDLLVFPEQKKKYKRKKKGKEKSIYDLVDFIYEAPKEKESIDQKIAYRERKQKLKSKLLSMIQRMNDCGRHKKSKDYTSKIRGKHSGTEADYIFESSLLWNGKATMVKPQSHIFKYRVLTLMFDDIIQYLDEIVDSEFEKSGRRVYEFEDKLKILRQIDRCLTSLQSKYMQGEPVMKEMVQIEYYFCNHKDKKKDQLVNTLVDHLGIIMDNKTIGGQNQLDDYVLINDLIKLAYVAVTENPNISKTKSISTSVTFADKNKIRLLIMGLGEDILKYKDEKGNLSLLYQEFLFARPQIETSYADVNHNRELREGIRALIFMEFLTNSSEIKKFIRKMI